MEELHDRRPSLVFRLFGGFEAIQDGQPIEGLHKRQADRLLAYLVLHASHWVEKDRLAAQFWGSREVWDKDQNLRQSLFYLRQLLGSDAGCLESRMGAIRIVLTTEQADTLQFEAACARAHSPALALAQQFAEESLLADWSDEWIAPFRDRYARKLAAALRRVRDDALPKPASAVTLGAACTAQPGGAGGIVPLNSGLYIERASDRTLTAAMQRSEGIILVKGPRQTGKSSLLARGLQFAAVRDWDVYHTDFEQFAATDLAVRDTLYLRLIASLAEQNGQEFTPENDWKPHLGAVGNLERFLRERVLKRTEAPILWTLDGVDSLFKTDYYNEFFALLRGIHSKRATQPTIPWNRFTLLIAAATEAHLYIRDLNQSPFNVGTRIDLADFDAGQRLEALTRCGMAFAQTEQQELWDLLGGHPYLLMRALQEIKTRDLTVAAFVQFAVQPDGPYHDHLEYLRRFVAADTELSADMRTVLDGSPCSDPGFFRLRSAGVVIGASPEAARPRCGLYRRYFARRLQ